jgi:hypothetical protein
LENAILYCGLSEKNTHSLGHYKCFKYRNYKTKIEQKYLKIWEEKNKKARKKKTNKKKRVFKVHVLD